jgi:hypothetical protein
LEFLDAAIFRAPLTRTLKHVRGGAFTGNPVWSPHANL